MRRNPLARRLHQCRHLTRRLIKPKHYAYLNRWRRKLGLGHIAVTLYAFPYARQTLARIALFALPDHHVLGLSTRSLAIGDWQNSIVHELLHALFAEYVPHKSRKLVLGNEEAIVELLSGLLSRGLREGRTKRPPVV